MPRDFTKLLLRALIVGTALKGLLLSAIAAEGLAYNPHAMDPYRACGPYCLTFLSRYYGNQAGYEKVSQLCPTGPQGTTLADIKRAAEEMGLHAQGVKTSIRQLLRLGIPSIVHLSNDQSLNHFAVLLSQNPETNELYLYSPPNNLGYEPCDEVESRFTGIALLVSPDPIPQGVIGTLRSDSVDQYWIVTLLLVCLGLVAVLATQRTQKQNSGLLLLLALIFSCTSCGCNLTQGDLNNKDERRNVDLGEIPGGDSLRYVFTIRNTTSRTVKITRVEKSCTCQDTDVSVGQSIEPADILRVAFAVPTDNRSGPHSGKMLLETDSEAESLRTIALSLKGNVRHPVRAIPSQLVFGNVMHSENPSRELRVESTVPGLLETFSEVSCGDPNVIIRKKRRVSGGLSFDVSILPSAPEGELHTALSFQFDHDEHPTLDVGVRARKLSPVALYPSRIFIDQRTSRDSKEFHVRVKSRSGEPFRITQVHTKPGITIEDYANEPAASFDLSLTLNDSFNQIESTNVLISTSHPYQAQLNIEVSPNSRQ